MASNLTNGAPAPTPTSSPLDAWKASILSNANVIREEFEYSDNAQTGAASAQDRAEAQVAFSWPMLSWYVPLRDRPDTEDASELNAGELAVREVLVTVRPGIAPRSLAIVKKALRLVADASKFDNVSAARSFTTRFPKKPGEKDATDARTDLSKLEQAATERQAHDEAKLWAKAIAAVDNPIAMAELAKSLTNGEANAKNFRSRMYKPLIADLFDALPEADFGKNVSKLCNEARDAHESYMKGAQGKVPVDTDALREHVLGKCEKMREPWITVIEDDEKADPAEKLAKIVNAVYAGIDRLLKIGAGGGAFTADNALRMKAILIGAGLDDTRKPSHAKGASVIMQAAAPPAAAPVAAPQATPAQAAPRQAKPVADKKSKDKKEPAPKAAPKPTDMARDLAS